MPSYAEGSVQNIPQEWWGAAARPLARVRELAQAIARLNSPYAGPLAGLLADLIGKKPEMLEEASYGFPPTQGTGMTLGPKPEYAPDFSSLVPQGGPLTSAAMKGLLAKAGPAAMIGALRKGGRPDLMASHGTSIEGVFNPDMNYLVSELYSPSLAITGHSKLTNPFERGLLLIPREGAFDPGYDLSTLFNRDAYLARMADYPGFRVYGKTYKARHLRPDERLEMAQNRLEDTFNRVGKPFSEGDPSWIDPRFDKGVFSSHNLAVEVSPRFSSFSAYEKSPYGAQLLVGPEERQSISDFSNDLQNAVFAWKKKHRIPGQTDWMYALTKAAGEGDEEARQLLRSAKTLPSDYAELKMHGPVPLTGEYWAGALMPPGQGEMAKATKDLATALRKRGIYSAVRAHDPEVAFDTAQGLQEVAGKYKFSRVFDVPWEGPLKYQPGHNVPEIDLRPDALMEASPQVKASKEPFYADTKMKSKDIASAFYEGEISSPEEALGQMLNKAYNQKPLTDPELSLYSDFMKKITQHQQVDPSWDYAELLDHLVKTGSVADFADQLKYLDLWKQGVHPSVLAK